MTSNGIRIKIDDTINLVFQCSFNEVIKNTLEIVEYIEKNIKFSDEKNIKVWKQIMQYLIIALENKDYLVVADIFKYELQPILEKEKLV